MLEFIDFMHLVLKLYNAEVQCTENVGFSAFLLNF